MSFLELLLWLLWETLTGPFKSTFRRKRRKLDPDEMHVGAVREDFADRLTRDEREAMGWR